MAKKTTKRKSTKGRTARTTTPKESPHVRHVDRMSGTIPPRPARR